MVRRAIAYRDTLYYPGMQQRIDALEADKTDLRAERDRLLSVIETQAQQVKLLSDQRPAAQPDAARRRRWWSWK